MRMLFSEAGVFACKLESDDKERHRHREKGVERETEDNKRIERKDDLLFLHTKPHEEEK